MKRYNVIWIDDEWEKQTNFIEFCDINHGIDITPFKNSKVGMDALESNLSKWDAIILDAKVFDESNDEIASTKGLMSSIKKIEALSTKKKVPYFISTGQPDLYSDNIFRESFGKFYSKDTDDEELINDLMAEADKQVETQIRHKYNDLFSWFPLPNELLSILTYIETESTSDSSCLNEVRKMLEWVSNLCIERGILPSEVKELNKFSRFLCLDSMKVFVPLFVQRCIHSCVMISQEGSHFLTIDNAIKNGEAPYLIRSTVFELLNILYWCKDLPNDEKEIREVRIKTTEIYNSFNTVKAPIFEGKIEQDVKQNYFCGEYLLNYKDLQNEDIGKCIKIFNYIKNTDFRNKDTYPYFVNKYNFDILD
ncbi:MAG: hypothetical protein PHE29_04235 [Tissierellia bacterium]|nr:hypothetical protein [Tissierellia bacterium]